MDTNKNIVETRRDRLRRLLRDRFKGRQARLVAEIGINAGELSGLLRDKHFGEKKARSLEAALGLPLLWLDGMEEKTETDSVVAEFAWLYAHVTETGKQFLREAIQVAYKAFVIDDRRQRDITPIVEKRTK